MSDWLTSQAAPELNTDGWANQDDGWGSESPIPNTSDQANGPISPPSASPQSVTPHQLAGQGSTDGSNMMQADIQDSGWDVGPTGLPIVNSSHPVLSRDFAFATPKPCAAPQSVQSTVTPLTPIGDHHENGWDVGPTGIPIVHAGLQAQPIVIMNQPMFPGPTMNEPLGPPVDPQLGRADDGGRGAPPDRPMLGTPLPSRPYISSALPTRALSTMHHSTGPTAAAKDDNRDNGWDVGPTGLPSVSYHPQSLPSPSASPVSSPGPIPLALTTHAQAEYPEKGLRSESVEGTINSALPAPASTESENRQIEVTRSIGQTPKPAGADAMAKPGSLTPALSPVPILDKPSGSVNDSESPPPSFVNPRPPFSDTMCNVPSSPDIVTNQPASPCPSSPLTPLGIDTKDRPDTPNPPDIEMLDEIICLELPTTLSIVETSQPRVKIEPRSGTGLVSESPYGSSTKCQSVKINAGTEGSQTMMDRLEAAPKTTMTTGFSPPVKLRQKRPLFSDSEPPSTAVSSASGSTSSTSPPKSPTASKRPRSTLASSSPPLLCLSDLSGWSFLAAPPAEVPTDTGPLAIQDSSLSGDL